MNYCSDVKIETLNLASPLTAYFSLEYGIHESIRLYSGGLGVLAGDHLKSASDLNIPLVAVGLFYKNGYFQQRINNDGYQTEEYIETDPNNLPYENVTDETGKTIIVSVTLPEGKLQAAVRKLNVGRIPLFLLDTNIPENSPEFREITLKLYGGDKLMRIRQEILLGIGGIKLLDMLNVNYQACHMNEGHAAFLGLARISNLMKQKNISLDKAFEITRGSTIFTTHTPVPAGNEVFSNDLIEPHLKTLEGELGIPAETALAWGRPANQNDQSNDVSMTVLGLRLAAFCNGVSKLHGKVAREMWAFLYPELSVDDVPISHITNGVHLGSWLAPDVKNLFEKKISADWKNKPNDPDVLQAVAQIPNDEIRSAHKKAKIKLIEKLTNNSFDENVLTIGFARRFATYKRATLIFKNIERIKKILNNSDKPVQLLIAGKAHPADDGGKKLIQDIIHLSQTDDFKGKIIFIEDYDIAIARLLVQGVDVWLNTPERPREASGTSGMKAAANGILNLSIPDGWWEEGFNGNNGWNIGNGEDYETNEVRDEKEAEFLYSALEQKVIPCFYDERERWNEMMKQAIISTFDFFSSHRMVMEYNERFYKKAIENFCR